MEREVQINACLGFLNQHYKPCTSAEADTNLTNEGVLQIFENIVDVNDLALTKIELKDLMESEGYSSKMIGNTLYWSLKKV
jgi:hypothetical protein